MTTRPFIAGALAGALLLAGCGSGGAGPTTTTSAPQPTTSTSAPSGDWRLAALEEARAAYEAPGAVAAILDDAGEWTGAVGVADLEGTPAHISMRFRAGSITKTLVAALALHLAGDGLLELDQSVEAMLPGVLRPGEPVTVRQLLDHTSGVFDEGNEGDLAADVSAIADADLRAEAQALLAAFLAGEAVVAPDRVIVALAESHPRYFAAGTGWHYSNPNYQLAGMVIEGAAGRPLAEVLADRISSPLGLASLSLAPADPTSPELRGYDAFTADGSIAATVAGGRLVDVTDDLSFFGNGGNGGLLTTAPDLARFFAALSSDRLLLPALLEQMREPSIPSWAAFSPYGLGLATYTLSCGLFYGHAGSVVGTQSIALADPEGTRVVVIAFNARAAADPGLAALADHLICGGA